MTTRSKEEQQLLDEKIARIQKKNEEILRRQKEIEEDKRLAEQQNAVVKLRPSTTNTSRERTPALRPSNRELREEFPDESHFQEPDIQRNVRDRDSFRRRGEERGRSQGAWKAGGPPPDPRSFLHDEERDGPPRMVGEERKDTNRGYRQDDREIRDDFHGGREYQRGGGRGGVEHRSERGRRGMRGGNTRNEEAWRAERMRIDEARIQRQKGADGKWRREWDNEKLFQGSSEGEPRYETKQSDLVIQDQQLQKQHQTTGHVYGPNSNHRTPKGGGKPSGRGRGRLNPVELEMPLDIALQVLQKHTTIPPNDISTLASSLNKSAKIVEDIPLASSSLQKAKHDSRRTVECIGDTVKISIPNNCERQLPPKPQRMGGQRHRAKSHTSYSSQSDDDSPRDGGPKGSRRLRNQKVQKQKGKNSTDNKMLSLNDELGQESNLQSLPAQNKPPLPPFRSKLKSTSSIEGRDEDGSWEDVTTTSGTESVGEDFPPMGINSLLVTINNSTLNESSVSTPDCTLSEYLETSYELEGEALVNPLNYSQSLNTSDLGEVPDLFQNQVLVDFNVSSDHHISVDSTPTSLENVPSVHDIGMDISFKVEDEALSVYQVEDYALCISSNESTLQMEDLNNGRKAAIESAFVPELQCGNPNLVQDIQSSSILIDRDNCKESNVDYLENCNDNFTREQSLSTDDKIRESNKCEN